MLDYKEGTEFYTEHFSHCSGKVCTFQSYLCDDYTLSSAPVRLRALLSFAQYSLAPSIVLRPSYDTLFISPHTENVLRGYGGLCLQQL